MGITYGILIYYHGVAEGNVDKKISKLEYKKRTVYSWSNNPFTYDFGIPALHLPTIAIDYRPRPHKISQYTPDMLPDAISVDSENYVSTFTTLSDSPNILTYDDHNTIHVMKKYVPFKGRVNRGYFCRKHGQIICYKNTRFYFSTFSDNKK